MSLKNVINIQSINQEINTIFFDNYVFMSDSKGIVWIASYPKSGNTWIRSIITSMLYTKDGNFNFELIKKIDQFETLNNFNFLKKQKLDHFEQLNKMNIVSQYWLEAQKRLIDKNKILFFKTHSANYEYDNLVFANNETTKGYIYVIRDPRDIIISYSKFLGISVDEMAEIITLRENKIYGPSKKIGVFLTRWDYHVASWVRVNKPKLILRYEDMLLNPRQLVLQIARYLTEDLNVKFNIDENKINNIVHTTSFLKLKRDEEKLGFFESSKNSVFFRSGKKNQWQDILTKKQLLFIEENFKQYMTTYKYI